MRTISALVVVSILVLLHGGPVLAKMMKDNVKCKQWHSVIGEWTEESEHRQSPTGKWVRFTKQYQFQWELNGSFLRKEGTISLRVSFAKQLIPWSVSRATSLSENSDGFSFMNILGYDASLATHIGTGFRSDGVRSVFDSGDWSGNIWSENWTLFLPMPDGRAVPGHCTVEYEPDFNSATGECQVFTDGTWWTDRKIKATKVK